MYHYTRSEMRLHVAGRLLACNLENSTLDWIGLGRFELVVSSSASCGWGDTPPTPWDFWSDGGSLDPRALPSSHIGFQQVLSEWGEAEAGSACGHR